MKNLNTKSQDYCSPYKVKNYKKLLLVLLLPFLSSNGVAMEQENKVEDGTYRIRCKAGQQSLELNPEGTVVRLAKEETNEQYQKWAIKKVGNNVYNISCFTKYDDKKYLEAFPIINSVKPEFEDAGEDDQEWQITKIEDAVYQIHCKTENCGEKYLEGYPWLNDVGLKNRTRKQDQKWELIKLPSK